MMGSAPIIVNGYEIAPNTNLRGADLHGCDLSGADLRNADLRNADLRNADLSNADLSDAYLQGCIWGNDKSVVSLGTDPRGYDFIAIRHDDGWRIKAGCRWFTLPEAIAHWTASNNRDALARLAILDAHPLPEGER